MNIPPKYREKLLGLILAINEGMENKKMRSNIGYKLLDLFDADFYGSYGWDSTNNRFCDEAFLNLDPGNHENYVNYYQNLDLIADRLKDKTQATLTSEVVSQSELIKTEFYNDFLAIDGLYRGLELRVIDNSQYLGDFRIWRRKGKSDFDPNDVEIMELIKPHLRSALNKNNYIRYLENQNLIPTQKNLSNYSENTDHQEKFQDFHLTKREWQVFEKLMEGKGDKVIASELHIEFTTLRSHIKNIFRKTETHNRTELCALLAKWKYPQN